MYVFNIQLCLHLKKVLQILMTEVATSKVKVKGHPYQEVTCLDEPLSFSLDKVTLQGSGGKSTTRKRWRLWWTTLWGQHWWWLDIQLCGEWHQQGAVIPGWKNPLVFCWASGWHGWAAGGTCPRSLLVHYPAMVAAVFPHTQDRAREWAARGRDSRRERQENRATKASVNDIT